MSKIHVTTTVNGDAVDFLADPRETLLDCLRDHLGLTGSKEGCGTGDCGACSVRLDGVLVSSCLVLGVEAEGRSIETIEGMASPDGTLVTPPRSGSGSAAAPNSTWSRRSEITRVGSSTASTS